MGLHKIKKSLHIKNKTKPKAIVIIKRQTKAWEKIFISYSKDNRLIFRIYK
jgi:hypothetical protein